MTEEVAQWGNRNLAKFIGKSNRTVGRLMKSMIHSGAVIPSLRGSPPRPENMWFPSLIRKFMYLHEKKVREKQNPGQ